MQPDGTPVPVRSVLIRAVALVAMLAVFGPRPSGADEAAPGVTDDRILFGQSAALSGPASALGEGMRQGILAAFHEINQAGGVNGRQLELISYDDRYEPEIAIDNTERLIGEDQVFALIGPVGTPTSMAAQPIATAARVPLIGPFTGAQFLRNPSLRSVINIRASYFQEAERIVDWLTTTRGAHRIAILYQDDSYGRAGRMGLLQALERRGLETVAEGVYPRNTNAVKRALLAIRRGNPDAIVIIGAYEPSAVFIQWARKLTLNAKIVNISFVGTDALIQTVGDAGIGTFISQVVPFPFENALPLVAEYRAAMQTLYPGSPLGFVSLEGYLAGRFAIAVLQQLGDAPTRESFLETIAATGHFDIGGFPLDFGPDDNQGSDQVFLTEIQSGGGIRSLDAGEPVP